MYVEYLLQAKVSKDTQEVSFLQLQCTILGSFILEILVCTGFNDK